ncbi:sugar transferase [Latilactobacillus sakei]|uniref:sugar transferase n=1 Tax=Latilactobacillus sakei TaxID=1599 RepID=UPI003F531DE5
MVKNGHNESEKELYIEKIGEVLQHPYMPMKHVLDVVFASIILLITSPVILLFMLLIRLDTPGNVFYSQERVGLMGKKFKVTKLRSMYDGIEKKSGAMWAQKNDPRVTKIGHFMRKTRIDELPQLWSVIKGDMSLIGPRPERPNFTEQFSKEYPGFEQRLRIKPGLSGYAQVHGGYDITPGEKAQLDVYYIEHYGFWLDLKIFFETIKTVLTGEGAR